MFILMKTKTTKLNETKVETVVGLGLPSLGPGDPYTCWFLFLPIL